MERQLTVAELIQVLQGLPQDMPVEIGMNQEYQSALSAEDIQIMPYCDESRGSYVHIGD